MERGIEMSKEVMDKELRMGNVLIKNFIKAPKRAIVDLDLMQHLTPREFYIYILLLNSPPNFTPAISWIGDTLQLGRTASSNVLKGLRNKNLVDIVKIDSYRYVWYVNNVMYDPDKHGDFVKKRYDQVTKEHEVNSKDANERIKDIETKLLNASGNEYQMLIDEMISIEQSKGK